MDRDAMDSAIESAVAALRSRPATLPAGAPASPPPPDAAAVVARLTDALPDHDTCFLDDYLMVIVSHSDAQIKIISDELMRNVEAKLAADEGENGEGEVVSVVVACWLAVAAAWRAPRLPSAARTLHSMLQHFTPQQVTEVARAVYGTLSARELLVASDATRGASAAAAGGGYGAAVPGRAWARAGAEGLTALLLRAALAKLSDLEPVWCAGALRVEELRSQLVPRWKSMEPEAQLTGAALAARVVAAAAARGEASGGRESAAAANLLAALAHPPPPVLRHHPEFLKATIALSKLQKVFKTE